MMRISLLSHLTNPDQVRQSLLVMVGSIEAILCPSYSFDIKSPMISMYVSKPAALLSMAAYYEVQREIEFFQPWSECPNKLNQSMPPLCGYIPTSPNSRRNLVNT